MTCRGLRGFGSMESIGTGDAELRTASVRSAKTDPAVRLATRARPPNALGGDAGIGGLRRDDVYEVFGGRAVVMTMHREVHADPVAVRDAADVRRSEFVSVPVKFSL